MDTIDVSSLTLHHSLPIILSKFYLQVLFPIGVQSIYIAFSFIIVSKYTIVDVQHFPKISMVQAAIERGPSQISYVKAWIVIGYGIIMGLMMMLL